MLKTILRHIDFLIEQIEMLDQEIAERVNSYEEDKINVHTFVGTYN